MRENEREKERERERTKRLDELDRIDISVAK